MQMCTSSTKKSVCVSVSTADKILVELVTWHRVSNNWFYDTWEKNMFCVSILCFSHDHMTEKSRWTERQEDAQEYGKFCEQAKI